MDSEDAQLEQDVIAANIEVHRTEAPYYDALHLEETNWWERRRRLATFRGIRDRLRADGLPLTALDVGCGTGKVSINLVSLGFDVTSTDLSIDMLGVFRKRLESLDLAQPPRLVCADMFQFLSDCPDRFALVVFCGTLHHVTDVGRAITLAAARLQPGGLFLTTHEPLKQPIRSRWRYAVHRAIARLDESLYRRYLRRFPAEVRGLDYSVSDFQRGHGGIAPDDVIAVLKAADMEVVELSKYCSRRYGLLAALVNALVRSENTFQILARKAR